MTVDTVSFRTETPAKPAISAEQAARISEVARRFEQKSMDGFGARLKEARKKAGLDQSEVADLVGKKRQAVYAWEKGKGKPQDFSPKAFASLCRRLRVSPEWLLYGVDTAVAAGTDPRITQLREIVEEFGKRYPSLAKAIDILGRAAETDSVADDVRGDILALRKVYRDLEDLLIQ